VKDALKLTLTRRLEGALGRTVGADAAPTVTLALAVHYVHPPSAAEADVLPGARKQGRGRHLNGKRRRAPPPVPIGKQASAAVAAAATALPHAALAAAVGVPPAPHATGAHVLTRARRLPLYVGGCYLKTERDVSQSPFFLEGARRGRTSVQEEIQRHLLPVMRADGAKFVTAGREDVDVRCLGEGRPFILEIANARAPVPSPDDLRAVEAALTASAVGVGVRRLTVVPRSALAAIKAGETSKRKTYRALVELPVPVAAEHLETLSSVRDLVLRQTTPTRVEHRRAMLVRERAVVSATAVPDPAGDPARLQLTLTTQAGLYVKEFVHGDGGRTAPSVGDVLGLGSGAAAILELDVLAVHMDGEFLS
jgi:tRNA pseudouridine synthase 10